MTVKKNQEAKAKRELIKQKNKKEVLFNKIKGREFQISSQADEVGTLYAGLDQKDIATAINKQGFGISPDEINLTAKIKKTGVHEINLDIAGRKTFIKLIVNS